MEVKNKDIEIHIVPQLDAPRRMQEYGIGIFKSIPTKSALKKILKKQFIKVDDKIATTATFINGGECISYDNENVVESTKRLVFPLKVLFEDDYLAIIHKPAGILVSGNSFKTIANALSQNVKRSTLVDAAIAQPVHRIDFATTGVLLVGKTNSSIRILNKMFENKEIDKTYYAVNIGEMDLEGDITSQIDGKDSYSNFKRIAQVDSPRFGKLNLLKLDPKTGRRHQLRKHLYSIGNPILGDRDYYKEGLLLFGKGMYLHAYSIEFVHPFTGDIVFIKDSLPENFVKLFPEVEL